MMLTDSSVQLPLPKHIDEQKVTMAIDYRKDVDGFHPVNVGRMSLGMACFISATPLGILTLLQHYNIETSGKKSVILGRSNIVGKPMAQLMMQKQYGDATVHRLPLPFQEFEERVCRRQISSSQPSVVLIS